MTRESDARDRSVADGSPFGSGDVVFTFSYETFADARARGMMRPPDRILGSLLERPDVQSLLVANPFRSALSVLRDRVRHDVSPFPATSSQRLITPVRLRRSDPTDLDGVEATYGRYGRALRTASRRMGQSHPDVITTHPLVAGFAPLDWAGGALYFGRDDWASSPARRTFWNAYRAAYDRVAASAMPVAAVSQQILDRIQPTGPSAVVPNGVEPAEWTGALPSPPGWFADIPGPRAVYVGTLDGRLDLEGITAIARSRPDVHLVLIGPAPDPRALDPLRRLASVHLHESVGRLELVSVLRNADLSLVAHRRTPLTEAMSPLKVYEYLAAGLPVISIDAPPVRGIDPRVTLVDTVADFVDVLDSSLARGRTPEGVREQFIAENSWGRRHESLFRLLHGR